VTQTRSLRRRTARRRGVAVRTIGPRLNTPEVTIELRDAKGIRQSFLILPGQEVAVGLNGYIDGNGGLKRIMLPVIVSARVI